jgi:hypothetical protein
MPLIEYQSPECLFTIESDKQETLVTASCTDGAFGEYRFEALDTASILEASIADPGSWAKWEDGYMFCIFRDGLTITMGVYVWNDDQQDRFVSVCVDGKENVNDLIAVLSGVEDE